MFGFDEAQDNYNQVYNDNQDHQSSFGHEVLAGGASFAAMKVFEDHQRKEGKPISHQFAKELIAGFAGAEVDKLAETKGENFFDRERAKHEAKKRSEQLYDQHYGQNSDQYDPNNAQPPQQMRDTFGGYDQGGYGGGTGFGGDQGGYGGDQGGYGGGQGGGYGGDQYGNQGGYGGGNNY